jgi:hypothetical protein
LTMAGAAIFQARAGEESQSARAGSPAGIRPGRLIDGATGPPPDQIDIQLAWLAAGQGQGDLFPIQLNGLTGWIWLRTILNARPASRRR